MAGTHDEYSKYMKSGQDAAWSLNWTVAAEHFTRAIQAKPDDAEAHVNLGLALLNSDQLDRALKVYRRAIQLAPDDPEPLERTADVLERMGQLREAAQQYVKVSELYVAMKDIEKAIMTWEHATTLTPGLVSVHARLAQAYERIGDKPKAIREYLVLAYNFRRLNETEKALKAVERALKIDPKNPLALNTRRALQAGGEVILPDNVINRKREVNTASTRSEFSGDLFWSPEFGAAAVEEANPLGPLGVALDEALELLAAHVLELGFEAAVGAALRAMEDQRQGDNAAAIENYLEAEDAGLRHPALKMNLGGLMVLEGRGEEAARHLADTLTTPALMSGGLHALGMAHAQASDFAKSARYLVQAMQSLSGELETNPESLSDAQSVYTTLSTLIQDANRETVQQVSEQFLSILSGEDWKGKVRELSTHLAETLRRDGPRGLIDILTTSSGDSGLPETVSTIDRYIRSGLYTLAMDECHRAIETAPLYLPVHIRMAEILMKEGRIRQAINKYNVVARAYMVRGENDRATAILTDVLKMAPLDIEVRANLIELLETEERFSDALTQYIDLANTYQQLGDFEKSNQTFAAAERMARRIEAPAARIAEIKHYIADLNQMRLNTRQAQKIYEEIIVIAPEDEKALRNLVDIYYGQNNQVEAVKRLDTLLGMYAKKGMINRITSLLEDLVNQYPNDMALHSRLASIYRKLGDTARAIEQLDVLGGLQLEAGLHKDAANTIKQIISLKPDRIEEYQKLLANLE
jgi:tetratricopeptide (TPR) repeat protein